MIEIKLPNGYGSVHKLTGNRRKPWRVRKTVGRDANGRAQYQNIGYYETRTEAYQALAEFNTNPWDVDSKKVTFGEIYQIILDQKEKVVTPASFKILRSNYNHTKPVQNVPVCEMKAQIMQDLLDNLDKSVAIKRKVKSIFTDVFKYALKNDIVKRDYAVLVDVGKSNVEDKKIQIFNHDEIKKIHENDSFYDDFTLMLICTGFRINELIGLETKDIHLDKGYMIGGSKTDAGKDRIVPISEHIVPIIKKYLDPANKYLFLTVTGKKHNADNLRRKWNEVFPQHRFHECRHTFSSLCNNAEMQKLAHQRIMGHVPTDITDRVYTHKTADDLIREMEKFDAYFSTIIS